MFERYTEKAIKVIILAQEEAHRLGHNFVGTEQILLGLIGEGTGVAAKVLKSMGINLKTARIEVEKIIGRGSGFVAAEIPFTPRAKLVLELSVEEAQQLGHNYIGTEHLLLGLIREGEGVGARVLENLDIDLGKVRTQVLRMLSLELPIRDTVRHSSKLLFEGFWSILAEMEKQGKINSDLLNSGKIKSVIEFLGSRKTNDFQQVNEYKMPPNLHWRALRGQVIDNKYFLTELLGYGAYGGVYLADEVFQKRDKAVEQVAIKLMIDDQTDSQLKELILSRKLQHPNVMACFERGECNLMEIDHLYLVMELADYSLETKLAEGDLSKVEKISLIKDITQALVYLHSQSFSLPDKKEPVKFVHLDLKPANVMKIGNLWKLTDFGLIRSISTQTALTNNPSGTALYAPPESYSGEISTAWDIWSLGIIIVKVLTGKYPFFAENLQQLQKKICDEEPDLSGLPKQFEKLVQGCLDKNRKNRWTAQQVLDEILSIQTSCYLLLYDLGLQFEGIYTIQTDNRHKILVFYEKEDANNFLKTLKEENNSYIYSIEVFDPEAIDNFCNILGIECEWITKNIKVILPEKRIYEKNESKETDQIYVLLYNAGKNNEGIHTIKNNDRNKVLMFKAKDDAIRFANLLEAENFPLPTIQDFAKSEIIKFCQSADYDYELIPEGQLAIPPNSNVEEYDIENLHFYNEPKSNSIWDNLKKVGESILGLWDNSEDSSASIFTIEEVHHNVKKALRLNAEIIEMTTPFTITEDKDSDLTDS